MIVHHKTQLFPQHGIVWVKSAQSLAVILEHTLPDSRIGCLLIAKSGFELKNMCNFSPSSAGIIDAAPLLKRFEDGVLTKSDPSAIAEEDAIPFAIGVALLKAATKLLSKCEKNQRLFPWNVLSPDLCLSSPMIRTVTPSLKGVFDESYRNFCLLVIGRGTLSFMNEMAETDTVIKLKQPVTFTKYTPPPVRATVTRRAQSSLRAHVKNNAPPSAARKFVEYVGGETAAEEYNAGEEGGRGGALFKSARVH